MRLKATSTGNAGMLLENTGGKVFVDSFFHWAPHVGNRPVLRGAEVGPADLILMTHAHPDHVNQAETAAAIHASGAVLAGPEKAVRLFRDAVPPEKLVVLEPAERKKPPAAERVEIGGVAVTAFRTYHGRGHNSYLIEMGGVRVYDDADSERTQPYDLAALGHIDLLLLCPWAGSGAGEFVASLRPDHWALIHMTDEEIAAHRRGEFLPPLIDPVPPGVVALFGGESLEIA